MALFLRDGEVSEAIGMDEMLEAIETMQRHFGQGEAYNLPRRKIIAEGGMLSVMGGGLYYDDVLGVKTYTVVRGAYSFQVSLYDANTGSLLLYTQANRLGQLRTGATTGVAVKHLSNPGAATVGIIGTGYQAPTQLEAVAKVRNIKKVKAFSRTAERREAFAASMSESLGIDVSAVGSSQEAVSGSDIVICIAAATEPVVDGDWVSPGATVIGGGPDHLAHPGSHRFHAHTGRQGVCRLGGPSAHRSWRHGQCSGPGRISVEPDDRTAARGCVRGVG